MTATTATGFVMLGRVIFIAITAALGLSTLSAPTRAAELFRLFDCGVSDSDGSSISLYGLHQDDDSWTHLQLVIEHEGIIAAMVPKRPLPGPGDFYFSNSQGSEGYYAQARISGGGRDYVLHMLDIPPDPAEASDMGGRWVGVRITQPNGVSYNLPCWETDEYIGYMAQAMNCDLTNRYGVAGCDFDARPERAADDKLPKGFAP